KERERERESEKHRRVFLRSSFPATLHRCMLPFLPPELQSYTLYIAVGSMLSRIPDCNARKQQRSSVTLSFGEDFSVRFVSSVRLKVDGAERNGFGFSSEEIGEAVGFHGTPKTSADSSAAIAGTGDSANAVKIAVAIAIAIDSASARATATAKATAAVVVFAGTAAETATAVTSGAAAEAFAGSSNSAPCEVVQSVVSILKTLNA
ncbi:hypothetical protein PIB30_062524, partial [Stylosanthes scabra]|nr:hypothetical protein [Stylosanthes scabra]